MPAKPSTTRKRRRNRSQVVAVWLKQSKWLMDTIQNLHDSPTGHGLKWTGKMVLHYSNQFTTMSKRTPKACEKQSVEYRERISSIIAEYADYID